MNLVTPADVHPAESVSGMTLRDYFAARAMQQFVHQRDHNVWASDRWAECRAEIAKAAYNIADAMLAAREGGSK